MILLKQWITELPVKSVLDIGTNTGIYAQMTAAAGKFTIAVDADTACINRLYKSTRQNKLHNLMPLTIDITHPSPAIGWGNQERASFLVENPDGLLSRPCPDPSPGYWQEYWV